MPVTLRHAGLLAVLSLTVIGGCSKRARYVDPDAVTKVEGTGIESRDLRAVAQQMARDLLAHPFLTKWESPPRLAVLPVENRSRFLIDQEIFTTLLTDMLIEDTAGRVAVLNRKIADEIARERAMKRSGQVDGTIAGKVAGADYFLEGTIQSLSASNAQAQTDYVVVRFQLTDAESGIITWADTYEMKKEGKWGVMYQ
jgi:penicillin-binding protein activator